jgi:hypothetical protein
MEALGDLRIGPFLDQPQNEQFALGVGEIGERPKYSRRKRQAVIDSLEVGVHNCHREAQTLPSAVFDPSLAQG